MGTLVLLGILVVLAVGDLANEPGRILLPAAAIGTLLFLLHRSRASRGIPRAGDAERRARRGAGRRTGRRAGRGHPARLGPARRRALRLGPARARTAPRPPRRRDAAPGSRPITLAAALLAGGVTALVLLASGAA